MRSILAIDQSTSCTKAMLFDENATIIAREDIAHKQIVSEKAWVEHDPMEIYKNTIDVVRNIISKNKEADILGTAISNQRETAVMWRRSTGEPVFNAVVWQCSRAFDICKNIEEQGHKEYIQKTSGLHLSPYFTAAKFAWIMQNVDEAKKALEEKDLCCGTIDTWLLFKLTQGKCFKTEHSNASRTQLLNIHTLSWDEKLCDIFGITTDILPELCSSDANFGDTDFEGVLGRSIPIHSMMGDSHGALFGQGCHQTGMVKSTYGTGSSVVMNIGTKPLEAKYGVVTSVAWTYKGTTTYELEGNINYTGATMKWVCDDLGLLDNVAMASEVAKKANENDSCYLVPAFTGLGAPYWEPNAKAMLVGMTRYTGKAEIVRAAEECIAYQISDIIYVMQRISQINLKLLKVDGGPTKDRFLMQFQSDVIGIPVLASQTEELSGLGVALMSGISLGLYDDNIFENLKHKEYSPTTNREFIEKKYTGWKKAVQTTISYK